MKKTIRITENADALFKCIRQESFSSSRIKADITKDKGVVCTITASDPAAMRAAISSLQNAISVFNNMRQV